MLEGWLSKTYEYQNLGLNLVTMGSLGTIIFTFVQARGLWEQNKTIWHKKSLQALSTVTFSYSLFYFISFFIYGIDKNSLAIMFNGLLAILCIPILCGIFKFKKVSVLDKLSFAAFTLMIPAMILTVNKDRLLILFLFGILVTLADLSIKIWKSSGQGAVEPKFLIAFLATNLCWFIYALAIKNIPLLIFNPIAAVMFSLMLFLLHKKKTKITLALSQ